MALSTRQTRYFRYKSGLCIVCSESNDRLPLQICTACSEHRRQIRANYYNQHKNTELEHCKEYSGRVKLKAFQKISGENNPFCVNCGCGDLRILEVNHVNGGGRQIMKQTGQKGGTGVWLQIIRGDISIEDLDVRCRICNQLHYISLKYPDVASKFIIEFKE